MCSAYHSESLLCAFHLGELFEQKETGRRASKLQHRHKTCNDPQIKHIHVLYFEGKMQQSKGKL